MDAVIQIGQPAPDFALPDLFGQPNSLADCRGKIVVVNFWSAECAWTERTDKELIPMLKPWGEDVALLCIASNANEPLKLLRETAAARGLPLVLHDANQSVARLYGVETTPHIFVVDAQGILRYHGAFDDVTFRERVPTRNYLREAVEAVQAGKRPQIEHAPPYGCALVYAA